MRRLSSSSARPNSDRPAPVENGKTPRANGALFDEPEGRKTLTTRSNHTRTAPITQQQEIAKAARAKLRAEARARREAEKQIKALERESQRLERELAAVRIEEAEARLRGVITRIDLEDR
ncbi:TPA: hypothetical protein OQU49_004490, partial [Shigella flexneri]|nr:hypothetical protein [Shigella flexneri]